MSTKGEQSEGDLLSDLVLKDSTAATGSADLVVEPDEPDTIVGDFALEVQRSLTETEREVIDLTAQEVPDISQSWNKARRIVEAFQPVPWFIWRLTNYVFGKSGTVKPVPEGMVIGLRRLLFAAASDSFLGNGGRVNNLRKALEVLPPDVVAAVSVIHAICRKLNTQQFDRIWRPILDDALLRAQIGFMVGARNASFGCGRGMLAGYSGRCGLAILVTSGDLEQARRSLEMLASGTEIIRVGNGIYGCDPLQIGAMSLSASGCGRDAAFGIVQFASKFAQQSVQNEEQLHWLSAFTVIEHVRMGKESEIDPLYWEALGFRAGSDRDELIAASHALIRQGHELQWLV